MNIGYMRRSLYSSIHILCSIHCMRLRWSWSLCTGKKLNKQAPATRFNIYSCYRFFLKFNPEGTCQKGTLRRRVYKHPSVAKLRDLVNFASHQLTQLGPTTLLCGLYGSQHVYVQCTACNQHYIYNIDSVENKFSFLV